MIAESLGVLAAIFQLVAYGVYAHRLLRDKVQPNTASWLIWAYGGVLEAWSYLAMSGDWIKSLMPVACSAACVGTFLLILGKGRLQRLAPWEWACVGFDVVSMFVWWWWGSAMWAHLLMQASVPVSFVPILIAVSRDPSSETPLPWALWCMAYVFGMGAVLLRWNDWPEAVYSVNYFIWTVAVLVLSKARRS